MIQSHWEELELLKQLGFVTNIGNKKVPSTEKAWDYFNSLINEKDSLPYNIDGVVIKLDDNTIVEDLGIVGKTPRCWTALKFPTEEVTTTLLGVTWQVGRTGKITPVAELEPVSLLGTTVKRATLHNFKEFLEKELSVGDRLVIRKAGDIIPEVVKKIA